MEMILNIVINVILTFILVVVLPLDVYLTWKRVKAQDELLEKLQKYTIGTRQAWDEFLELHE